MTPTELHRVLLRTLRHAIISGELPSSAGALPDGITLRKPPHGDADFASHLALRLAPVTGRPARAIAETLRSRLVQEAGIDRVEVAGPGFLNITLRASAHTALVAELLRGPGNGPAAAGSSTLPEDPARDAARWAELTGRPVCHERRDTRPLFRVQYARARSHALVAGAHALGFAAEPGSYRGRAEIALLTLLADTDHLAERVRRAVADADADAAGPPARARGPEAALAHHLVAVADAFLAFTSGPDAPSVLPRGDEKPEAAHRSRLALAEATGTVLAGGLTQLGISAPHYL